MKLNADAYDTLEFVAEVYDGVGHGRLFKFESLRPDNIDLDSRVYPGCILGMLMFAKGISAPGERLNDADIVELENTVGCLGGRSDSIVRNYLYTKDHGVCVESRMPFALWAPAVGLERADA